MVSFAVLAVAAATLGSLVVVAPDPPTERVPLTADDERATTRARPYSFQAPDGYDPGEPTPLVVLLHGYSSHGEQQQAYFHLQPVAQREGFALAAPDGTADPTGSRFWNATDACCNFFGSDVDDVAYLEAVIDEISDRYTVDADRVYLIGHSNGGFMAHRFACDRPGRVAAIVSLAGAQWNDSTRCRPDEPVHVLQVHGDQDGIIAYDGGATPGGRYPGAVDTAAIWAGKNGCDGRLTRTGETIDIEAGLAGPETVVARHGGCQGGSVELWTIRGGRHVPDFDERWPEAAWRFMAAHPKRG